MNITNSIRFILAMSLLKSHWLIGEFCCLLYTETSLLVVAVFSFPSQAYPVVIFLRFESESEELLQLSLPVPGQLVAENEGTR